MRIEVPPTYLGTAGWSLPRANQDEFPAGGSHLGRYAARFHGAEINSTFYKPHRASTFKRWASSVPAAFRFSVKLPKTITHEKRLVGATKLLDEFLASLAPLQDKLACLLVQMPPSFALEAGPANRFFTALRRRTSIDVAAEPRHPTWFTPEADALLAGHRVSRVAADPQCVPEAATPGGFTGLAYYRLHGSPRMYYSSYDNAFLERLAAEIAAHAAARRTVWCIFDNTASGAAMGNLLTLDNRVHGA